MHFPILAHTERYTALVRHPKAAIRLREELALGYQVNCNTIIQPKGFFQKRFIKAMFAANAVDHIATDAHNVTTRLVNMQSAIAALVKYGADAGPILQRSADLL